MIFFCWKKFLKGPKSSKLPPPLNSVNLQIPTWVPVLPLLCWVLIPPPLSAFLLKFVIFPIFVIFCCFLLHTFKPAPPTATIDVSKPSEAKITIFKEILKRAKVETWENIFLWHLGKYSVLGGALSRLICLCAWFFGWLKRIRNRINNNMWGFLRFFLKPISLFFVDFFYRIFVNFIW